MQVNSKTAINYNTPLAPKDVKDREKSESLKDVVEEAKEGKHHEAADAEIGAKEADDRIRRDKKKAVDEKRKAALKEQGVHDPADLIFDMSKKLADQALKASQKFSPATQENLKDIIDRQIQNDSQEKTKDTIFISKDARPAYQKVTDELIQKNRQLNQQRAEQSKQDQRFQQREGITQNQAVAAKAGETVVDLKKNSLAANKEKVTHYLQLLAQNLVTPDQKKLDEMRHTKESLLSTGVSPGKLSQLESTVSGVIYKDIRKQLKTSFTQLALAMDKKAFTPDQLKLGDIYHKIEEYAMDKGAIGEGRVRVSEVKADAKKDLQAYVSYELDNAIMETRSKGGSIQELVKEFDKYNKIAGIAQFNSGAYIRTVQKKLEDWGLNDFERPEELKGVIDTNHQPVINPDAGGSGSKNQQNQQQPQSSEDELRTLALQLGVKQDFASMIDLNLKIMAIKRKMGREGTHTDAQIRKILEEGQALAKVKLNALMQESLEEKASTSDIKSPAFRLAHKKYKNAIKGLKKLDALPSRDDIIAIRDQINTSMFSIIREEYMKVKIQIEALKDNVQLKRREKDYRQLLERLKAESNIKEAIEPRTSKVLRFSADNKIAEAA
jgi:hypothetical protein